MDEGCLYGDVMTKLFLVLRWHALHAEALLICSYCSLRDPMVHLGTATRVCFVKFTDPSSVHVAQHLTNTVFIDRALIVVPVQDGELTSRDT